MRIAVEGVLKNIRSSLRVSIPNEFEVRRPPIINHAHGNTHINRNINIDIVNVK
jgi:hypothetical protein